MSDVELVNDYPTHPLLYEEAYLEPYRATGRTFIFAGWEFVDYKLKEPQGSLLGHLSCCKPLANPEAAGVFLSYKGYGMAVGKDYAAAWLIAHWYEHLLEVCECLGATRSNFRSSLISSLLYLQAEEAVV